MNEIQAIMILLNEYNRSAEELNERLLVLKERAEILSNTDNSLLLKEAMELLAFATYHDGRYDQMTRVDWQTDAQKLTTKICNLLNIKPYEKYTNDK